MDSSRSLRNGQGPQLDVLSYTPGRHLAFLRYAPDEAPVFGKFLRRSDADEAYGKLCRVFAAVKRSRCIFSVPAPIRIDPDNGLFFQEARPGRDLTVLLNKENFVGLLYSVGQIHRDLHQLDVADVPEWDFDAFLQLCRHKRFTCALGLKFMMYEALLNPAEKEKLRKKIFKN